MDQFERELKLTFLDEATQMLEGCEQGFLSLESAPNDRSIIEQIFRVAHSFKGSAGAAGFDDLALLAHHLEALLVEIKSGNRRVCKDVVNVLLKANDELRTLVITLKGDPSIKVSVHVMVAEIERVAQSKPAEDASLGEVQIVIEGEHAPLVDVEASDPGTLQKKQNSTGPVIARDETIRVNLGRIDDLLNSVGELVILQTVLYQQRHALPSNFLQKTVSHLEKITRQIQDTSMSLRMIPIKQCFQRMQRIVRDAAHDLGKQINLVTLGEETEIDKIVLDVLMDPLVHLIRNAVDHGVENPEQRTQLGKRPEGTVNLRAFHQGEFVVIEVEDDGQGLHADRLMKRARQMGLISETAQLSEEEARQLVFAPGFSTKEEVTSISGRGVGMDVVKTYVEQIQGRVEIESTVGKGTCFRILLPLTLAIVDGMVVKMGQETFVIPISAINESIQTRDEDVTHVSGRGLFLNVRGETMKLFRMSELLGRRHVDAQGATSIAIVVHTNSEQAFAVMVDEIIGQQQIVIKKLGLELQGMPGITGAAILGDGRAALIVDIADVVHAHVKRHPQQSSYFKEAAHGRAN